MGCLLILLMVLFDMLKFQTLTKSNLCIFLLFLMLLVLHLRNHCLIQSQEDLLQCYIRVLAFTFRPVIHFVLIFVYGVRGIQLHCFGYSMFFELLFVNLSIQICQSLQTKQIAVGQSGQILARFSK